MLFVLLVRFEQRCLGNDSELDRFMIYLLSAIEWTTGGSSTACIYTQYTEQYNETIHRTVRT